MASVGYDQILSSLRFMGIREGDVLLVHSALTSIGYVEGGADAVIDALMAAVGRSGTLVMSTLTGWASSFDPEKTPSAVGIISEVFRRRPGVLRSLHPVHSVAACGARAEEIVKGHERCATGCGEGTPYMKIIQLGGKVMLLGVDMDRNTMMHTLEEAAGVQYLLELEIPAPNYPPYNGKGTFVLRKFPPGHRDFLRITPDLRKAGVMKEGRIGKAVTKVMEAKGLFEVGLRILKEDPLYFICKNEMCNFCVYARNQYTETNRKPVRRANHCVDGSCEICVPPAV